MKYSGTLMIVDDEGNIVHNRTLTTDEMIDEILKSSVSVAHVSEAVDESPEEETPATPPQSSSQFYKVRTGQAGKKGRPIHSEGVLRIERAATQGRVHRKGSGETTGPDRKRVIRSWSHSPAQIHRGKGSAAPRICRSNDSGKKESRPRRGGRGNIGVQSLGVSRK